jgi:hypothetical protein
VTAGHFADKEAFVRALALIFLIASPARGDGWRGGLRAEVTGTVRVHRLVRGAKPDEEDSHSQIRFSLRTEATAESLRVILSDAKLVSFDGPAALRNDLDREAAWYSAKLRFVVGRDGHFLDVEDVPETLRRIRDNVERTPSFTPELHEIALAGVSETALRTMLKAEWEALAGDRETDAKEKGAMPLADGTLVEVATRTRRESAKCPDGSSGCARIVTRGVTDNEAVRAHLEEALGQRGIRAHMTGVDMSLAGETLLSRQRLPLAIKRVARRNLKLVIGEIADETLQEEETQLAFRWLPTK